MSRKPDFQSGDEVYICAPPEFFGTGTVQEVIPKGTDMFLNVLTEDLDVVQIHECFVDFLCPHGNAPCGYHPQNSFSYGCPDCGWYLPDR